MMEFLLHNRIRLALHKLKDGEGVPLLLLHGLGECSPNRLPQEYAGWQGAVHTLDFSGHGLSDHPKGGGYTCEYLMADVDIALSRLGPSTVAGRGLGAYIALLIAGARPHQVRGAILRDGPGLNSGAGSSGRIPAREQAWPLAPDPFALAELSTDMRPPDYAAGFALLAKRHSGLAAPIHVCALEHADWLAAVVNALALQPVGIDTALAMAACVAEAESIPNMRER